MNRKTNQHHWDHLKHQLYESSVEQLGNNATYWQDFHQASMVCSVDKNSLVGFRMGIENIIKFQKSLTHDAYCTLKLIPLLEASEINQSLSATILQRTSCRERMVAKSLSFQDLSDLLYYGYGQNSHGSRNVPSGGALYPLDIYLYSVNVASVAEGLYYYSPKQHGLKPIGGKAEASIFEGFFGEQVFDVVKDASVYIFITASFLKSIWKYSERGYRFSLMEAGHVAQNMNLVSTAKHLACLNIGGFYDWETNEFLGLDGVLDANLYMVSIGFTSSSH